MTENLLHEKLKSLFPDAIKIEERVCKQLGYGSKQCKFTLHFDEEKEKLIFVKQVDPDVAATLNISAKEHLFYTTVIPQLLQFVESSCNDKEIQCILPETFPHLFGHFMIGDSNYFVFQDFISSGYEVVTDPPRPALPIEQRMHAVERVAMFQGAMLALKQSRKVSFSSVLMEDRFLTESGFDFFDGALQVHLTIAHALAKGSLENNATVNEKLPNFKDSSRVLAAIEKLRKQFPRPFQQAYHLAVNEDTTNLIWGDCHGRNIAVKGEKCIFFDFQLARKWDSLEDYVQLVAACFSLSEKIANIDKMDEIYHSTLLRTLASFGITDDPYKSLEGFTAARKRLAAIHLPYFSLNAFVMDLFVDRLGMDGYLQEVDRLERCGVEGVIEWATEMDRWTVMQEMLDTILDYESYCQ